MRRRQTKASEGKASDLVAAAALRAGAYESFLGALPSIGQGHVKSKEKFKPTGDPNEFRVESKRKRRLKEYDRLLKSFKYSAALDSVLRQVFTARVSSYFAAADFGPACTTYYYLLPHSRTHPPGWSTNSAFRPRRRTSRAHPPLTTEACCRPAVWRDGV